MRNFKSYSIIALLCLNVFQLRAQSVGIGQKDFQPDESAILELRSENQGILIPRMTASQKNAISNPPLGLLIFQKNEPIGFYFYSQGGWQKVGYTDDSEATAFQKLSFDYNQGILKLEEGGQIDLSQYLIQNSIFKVGNGEPADSIGPIGSLYLDTKNYSLYGPKSSSGWSNSVSLIGPKGEQGDKGDQGETGPQGPAGAKGEDGTTVLNGSTDPDASIGAEGDFYINTATNEIFGPKTAGVWGSATSLVGPQGKRGEQGPKGDKGDQGETGPQGPAGANGEDGKTVLNGSTDPDASIGAEGDFYINTATNEIFGPKTAGVWGSATSLVGPQGKRGEQGPKGDKGDQGETGPQGPAGANGQDGTDGQDGEDGKTVLHGTTDPDASIGAEGDFYINTATNEIFGPKTAGAWGDATSLVGPQGEQGIQGPQGDKGDQGETGPAGADGEDGQDGEDGKTVLNGNTDPDASIGAEGDFYINTTTNEIFGPKTAGAWGDATSLVGPQGKRGEQGIQGPKGDKGEKGETGPQGPAGADGEDGQDGENGKTVLSGNTDPDASIGAEGDFFINTATNEIFGPKTAGAWGAATSLVGPQGEQGEQGIQGIQGPKGDKGEKGETGPQGPAGADGEDGQDGENGKTVLNGSTDPDAFIGAEGDFYINTTSNEIFGPKTAGAWGDVTSLVGPQGEQGIQGPQGERGEQGIQGEQGPQGEHGEQGPQGPAGADGQDGEDGRTVLNGTTDPDASIGVEGDFYINTTTNEIFGPKTARAWGDGTSLVGPTGPSNVYVGSFRVDKQGRIYIRDIPFQPSQITFIAHANIEDFGLDSDNQIGNNHGGLANAFGTMHGYARDEGGSFSQGVIYLGSSADSPNDVSRYSSNTQCIGLRYSDSNGNTEGYTLAAIASFDADGFSVQVSQHDDDLLVFYTAYQ